MTPAPGSTSYLDDLNPQQREAVEYSGGPLLIVAGAGSGKTRVLTYRIAHLIHGRGASPWDILALTFTNKAAGEMKERVGRLVGVPARDMMVGTFHSSCARILRREIEPLGYGRNFSIYDDDDSVRLIKQCLDELGLDRKRNHPRAIKAVISDAKSEMVDEESFGDRLDGDFATEVAWQVYRRYQERMRANNALDFDDLLLVMLNVFELYPAVLEQYRDRYRHVLVDEYQDTNKVQYRLVKMLSEEHRDLCVVGDDDQGIYSWRGADIRNILEFEKDYPDAHVVKLEQNYRSTPQILSAANSVVRNNQGRKPKTLRTSKDDGARLRYCIASDEHAEAAFVCAEIEKLSAEGKSYNQAGVFYRTHAQSRVIEEELIRVGIPYKVFGGTKFYDRREIRDTVAYLRLLANPRDDVSLRRIINVPSRHIGKTTVASLEEFARSNGLGLMDALVHAGEIPNMGSGAVKYVSAFVEMMSGLSECAASLEVDRLIEEVWERTGYMDDLQAQRTIEAETRIENLKELQGVAADFRAEYGTALLDDFLERVALVSDTDDLDSAAGYVSLMTLHNAKGLEFDAVFIVGMEEGVLPHARSIDDRGELEEERRLCYVGMTRARELLYMSSAETRSLWGGPSANPASRFIGEIPLEHVEPVSFDTASLPRRTGLLTVQAGDAVAHDKWGPGTVVSLVELDNDWEVTVDFETVGEKRLLLSFAPLSLS
jgi:DNA helicase-2/ATP-dependent DNA helicase PcrA